MNSNALNISLIPVRDVEFILWDESNLSMRYTVYCIPDFYPFFVEYLFFFIFLYSKWSETKRCGSSWLLPYLPTLGWISFLTPGIYSLGLLMHSKSKYDRQKYMKSVT